MKPKLRCIQRKQQKEENINIKQIEMLVFPHPYQ